MKTIVVACILALGGSFVPSSEQSNVYICLSPNAKKYHFNKSCKGLQRCTHDIKLVSKTDAINKGLTVCLIEK